MFNSNPFALLDENGAPTPAAAPAKKAASATTPAAAAAKPTKSASTAAPAKKAAAAASANEQISVAKNRGKKRDGHHAHRGGRGRPHGNGRQFDRHSGALPDSERKVKAAWGAEGDVGDDATATAAADDFDGDADVPPTPKEEPVKTLDEYLAERAAAALSTKAAAAKPVREVKADDPKWKNAVPLTRPAEDHEVLFAPTVATKEKKAANPAAQPKKQFLDIAQTFYAPPSSGNSSSRGGASRGGARGGRGGAGRGVAGRGAGRGGRGASIRGGSAAAAPRGGASRTPNVVDTGAFPKLG